jgi:hypothetical protein
VDDNVLIESGSPIASAPSGNDTVFTIGTLTITGGELTIPKRTTNCPGGENAYPPCNRLTVTERGGLTLSGSAKISIEGGSLIVQGGGDITIGEDARIEFNGELEGVLLLQERSTEGELSCMFRIPGGSSNPVITGVDQGVIDGGRYPTLLLYDREITGKLAIRVRLLNYGRVVAGSGQQMRLMCEPKGGSGLWLVNGGTLTVDIPVCGTVDQVLTVSSGTLEVNDFWISCGTLNYTGGTITTAPERAVLFGSPWCP